MKIVQILIKSTACKW